MPSDPTILAFDTSAAHCAAALLRGGEIVASRAEAMSRGQAERLMPLLEELLAQAGCTWSDLDAIGVGIGPGNFTGIRISVSAARGLALGLDAPVVGVSGFDALTKLSDANQLPCIAAPRDQVYVQVPGSKPSLMPKSEAEALGPLFSCQDPEKQVQAIARLTAERWHDVSEPPAPLYVRPADAAPSRDVSPVLLDE
ncbi:MULTISPECIES: tRNA (adenosine(37)-N6)-threonylcarbamoyltransferase complex dimerization subunit type 1 TsaB [unclassified Ruegeria]|uniref:tRNA (adenosine(37)-N6)-threonylcarbamoyltransferase complex dimerization subunit type 1 TsaB n=1 Tax=unclassified Ruegeria TaxID=2625375 RepID=UPI001487B65D|nr:MULTISPECIES: tRNA (adenosine(37)-N6)-threonylcarbamoyltransferase complex dimerization subunit type 1 TsaB [unclassified Ruegeria]NOD47920.1 tRNA (adenosine(37)-N6)-threonylcarbamoyltransferase complex dimerization subunit type 1 TsaB [Ruegeria sp. HKCCD5849]NOD52904.1 tRNA (adenosine(37)-N6)-threonylcarbamoyltransferase complex dimerization subunit type 1 TsaB [Ruegeria sp. HKCCD5851]NOD69050.1 tRNA (adenosine(37)-N6)-threonylcarbamoyltransferase complex dimerization subunit type 1 TsaB [Ru